MKSPTRHSSPRGERSAISGRNGGVKRWLQEAIPIWREVVAGVAKSPTALFARLDALLAPERVEDANMLAEWRRKYKNEITVRTKDLFVCHRS